MDLQGGNRVLEMSLPVINLSKTVSFLTLPLDILREDSQPHPPYQIYKVNKESSALSPDPQLRLMIHLKIMYWRTCVV